MNSFTQYREYEILDMLKELKNFEFNHYDWFNYIFKIRYDIKGRNIYLLEEKVWDGRLVIVTIVEEKNFIIFIKNILKYFYSFHKESFYCKLFKISSEYTFIGISEYHGHWVYRCGFHTNIVDVAGIFTEVTKKYINKIINNAVEIIKKQMNMEIGKLKMMKELRK